MKAEGKTWAQISEALGGKDRGALKQRYRELMGAKAGAPNEGKKKEEGKGKGKEEDQNGKDGKKGDGKEVGGLSTENVGVFYLFCSSDLLVVYVDHCLAILLTVAPQVRLQGTSSEKMGR